MALKLSAYGQSDMGRVRGRNEDSLCVEPSRGIAVVADGMGGAPAGDVASALAVEEVARGLHAGEGMEEAIRRADRRIREMAAENPELAGMGTTVTALVVRPEEEVFVVGHVGDSRAYRLAAGEVRALTRDHTMVRKMVERGDLPPEGERHHPLAHILSQALGVDAEVEVDVLEGTCGPGDRFLLCSDGLVAVMSDDEIGEWLENVAPGDTESVVTELVAEANRRGAPDNVTVALVALDAPLSASEPDHDNGDQEADAES